jgi:6-phosphogluconolactonase (cycloisomerase 2 family)
MRKHVLLALLSIGVFSGLASAAAASTAAHASANAARAAAVFVATNEPAGNRVVAYARAADGTLTLNGSYATGGKGAVEVGAVVDTLASQGSLVYDAEQHLLFAVNAGSDSLSVFGVEGGKLALRQVVDSGGSFPSSVAVSGNLVYVLNAGGAGSVQGFRITDSSLRALRDGSRPLGLANSEPPFFLSSPAQVGFSPNGSQLLVTTKGSGSLIDVFGVHQNGSLSAAPVANSSATPVPFAFAFDPVGRLVVAEAGASTVSTYVLAADGTLSGAQSQADGQAALCWIIAAGGNYYVANAGSATISGYRVDANGAPSLIGPTGVVGQTEAGAIDLATTGDQHFLYAESGGAGTVDEFQINNDGTLTKLGIVTGLPVGLEGIAST